MKAVDFSETIAASDLKQMDLKVIYEGLYSVRSLLQLLRKNE